jgi:beta-glucosidase
VAHLWCGTRPREAWTVQITLDRDSLRDRHLLQFWDGAAGRWATAAGTYRIHVGPSVETRLEDTISVQPT